MIDIMYCTLSYVSGVVLLLKTLVLYIYRSRGIMQYTIQYSRGTPLSNKIKIAESILCSSNLSNSTV
jgi:hypothetical protein